MDGNGKPTGNDMLGKPRVLVWWLAISLACAAMAVFIVFGVLDLDGSNLNRGSRENTLAADPLNLEAERLLSVGGNPSAAPTTERLSTLPSPPLNSVVAHSTTTPPALRVRFRMVHLGAGKAAAQRTVSPTPNDPA